MTRESQEHWQHSIPPEPCCQHPRVSFTFRKMDPAALPPQRWAVPSIREDATPSRPLAPNKRVLFLTDSVNCGLKTHLFHATGLTCIKEPDFFELASIDKYVDQFAYTDYVVISAGVNDISRYGHSTTAICNFICDKLRDWVHRFPNTIFIFNSILSTDFVWLNRRIKTVNRALFNLSLELYDTNRFYFLDTHALVLDCDIPCVLSTKGNGVHLSHDASILVQRCLVDCVIALNRRDSSNMISKVWPLRREFQRTATAFHDRRSRYM